MRLQEIIDTYSVYLDKINVKAYQDIFLLSNPTLSKNPYTQTSFLQNMIDKRVQKHSFIKHMILFYLKNIVLFFLFLFPFLYAKVFASKKYSFSDKEVVLIDTFYGDAELGGINLQKDKYFSRLYKYMDKKQIAYYITPKLYGFKNPFKYIHFYKIFRQSDTRYFFDLNDLHMSDLVRIGMFIISYPWYVYRLRSSVSQNDDIDKIFFHDLAYSLSGTDFYPYMRYLFGKNLSAKFKNNKLKVISWCEYQVIDKNFYKGLRVGGADITIFATQFLFKYPTYVSLYIPEQDYEHGIAPDTILVTGKYYQKEDSHYHYKVGPALRYAKLYETSYKIDPKKKKIVVMLPYVQDDAFSLIKLLKKSRKFASMAIDFKIHPDYMHEKEKYEKMLSSSWKIIDTYPDFNEYGFVISSGSGSVMELACVGMSVIITASQSSFTTNPMPQEGKEQNWILVSNVDELEYGFETLVEFKQKNSNTFEKNVRFYREYFLSKVDDVAIKENFEFDK